jgi:DNA mismatch repair protein MutS2
VSRLVRRATTGLVEYQPAHAGRSPGTPPQTAAGPNLPHGRAVPAVMNAAEIMDAHTLGLLEFDKVREILAGYGACSLGKELARQVEPLSDPDKVREELALVTEMTEALGLGQAPPLGGLHDVRLVVRRAAIGAMLTAEELLSVADTLVCTGNVYRYRMRLAGHLQRLNAFLAPVEDLGLVAKSITGCIDARGHVLDMASRELALVRQKLADLDERVKHEIARVLRDPELRKVLRYPNATVNGDHYVLPVAVNHRHRVPGVVHRTSATGETVFIEPAGVARLSAERAVLKAEEDREVKRVLRRLSAEVARVARPLSYAIEIMAKLDLVTAKARYSRDYRMYEPDLNDEGRLWLRQARHPLLEHLFRQEKQGPPLAETTPREVVPIDVRLGFGFNLLVITGPNTGGKTVCLKTTGLLCVMAQSGLHVPAGEGSNVPIFSHVLADIGDEQSLEQSLSTFSSHVSRIASILSTADDKSLVLLDELGAGTDPVEGAALGRAILDQLDQIGCRAMVTTHLGDLKTYAFHNDRAENGAVEFDVQTLRPTYRLHLGQFGMSNALKIARRLKLPRELLQRAHKYLRRRQRRAPEMLRLQQLREQAEKAKAEALVAQHEAERQREEMQRKAEQLQREADEAAALREARARLKPRDVVRVARFDKQGSVVRVDHKKNVAVVSVGLGQWEIPLDEIFPVESK